MHFKILMIAADTVFCELANAIAHSIRELGHQAEISKSDKDFGKNGTIVIKAFRRFEHSEVPRHRILFQPEELWNRRDRGFYDLSNGWTRVLEMFKENTEIKKGTENVFYCPIGWSPAFETDLPEVEEDIDVYFYGSMLPRREKFFKELREKTNLNIRAEYGDFGIERDKLIMRSKVILNIKANEKWFYTSLRCLLAQCKKKIMLCEKADGGYGPYIPGKHFFEFNNMEEAIEKISYLVNNPKTRENFANDVYNDLKKNYNFTKFLASGLKGII